MAWRAKRVLSSVSIQERKTAMARNNRRNKSSFFSIFSIFKACCSPGTDNTGDEAGNYESMMCHRYEDTIVGVADPGIDRKASDYIARIYATRDPQTLAV